MGTGSREMELLINLMKASLQQAGEVTLIEGWDGERLVKLIERQKLVSMVYPVIKQQEGEAWTYVQKTLEIPYMRAVRRTLMQEREIQKLIEEMEKAQMDCLPLKGWILRAYYPDRTLRNMADFDVLLKNFDGAQVQAWMEKQGYTAKMTGKGHHDVYLKKPYMNVEIHNYLLDIRKHGEEGPFDIWAKSIWERCLPVEGKSHVYQMTAEDYYIFHLIHMHYHFTSAGIGMRSIADIYVYLKNKKTELDQKYLNQELDRMGLLRFAECMERLSRIWFDGEKADEESILLTEFLAGGGMYGSWSNRQTIKVMGQTDGSYHKKKIAAAVKYLFPDYAGLEWHYPWLKKYPFMRPACRILRILQIAFCERKKVKSINHMVSGEEYRKIQRIYRSMGLLK